MLYLQPAQFDFGIAGVRSRTEVSRIRQIHCVSALQYPVTGRVYNKTGPAVSSRPSLNRAILFRARSGIPCRTRLASCKKDFRRPPYC